MFHLGDLKSGGFSIDACRSMVALMDVSCCGACDICHSHSDNANNRFTCSPHFQTFACMITASNLKIISKSILNRVKQSTIQVRKSQQILFIWM